MQAALADVNHWLTFTLKLAEENLTDYKVMVAARIAAYHFALQIGKGFIKRRKAQW